MHEIVDKNLSEKTKANLGPVSNTGITLGCGIVAVGGSCYIGVFYVDPRINRERPLRSCLNLQILFYRKSTKVKVDQEVSFLA